MAKFRLNLGFFVQTFAGLHGGVLYGTKLARNQPGDGLPNATGFVVWIVFIGCWNCCCFGRCDDPPVRTNTRKDRCLRNLFKWGDGQNGLADKRFRYLYVVANSGACGNSWCCACVYVGAVCLVWQMFN